MKPVANDTLISQLEWRYATKSFDASKKISADDWATLQQALILAPSSYGLQPWKFIVVQDSALRAQLQPASYGQSQIVDASHLVVFAVQTGIDEAYVDHFVDSMVSARGVSKESLAQYQGTMSGSVKRRTAEQNQEWAARQVYIALGVFLSSAAMLGIDACPMEGFDEAKYDQILGLSEQGLHAAVLATAGYRSKDDGYASAKKVRFDAKELIISR